MPSGGGVLSVVNSYAGSYLSPTAQSATSRAITGVTQPALAPQAFPQAQSPTLDYGGALSTDATLPYLQTATSPQPASTLSTLAVSGQTNVILLLSQQ